MTVAEMIRNLETMPPDAEVLTFDDYAADAMSPVEWVQQVDRGVWVGTWAYSR